MPNNLRIEGDAVLDKFIARYRPAVTAVLSGFDRLVFRGTLLPLVMERGMHTLLSRDRGPLAGLQTVRPRDQPKSD